MNLHHGGVDEHPGKELSVIMETQFLVPQPGEVNQFP
jgi:hypothetical protein